MKLLYASLAAAISAYREIPIDTLEELNFKEWKAHHGITYPTLEEDLKREQHFHKMRSFVRDHNKKYKHEKESYYTSMNRFADA